MTQAFDLSDKKPLSANLIIPAIRHPGVYIREEGHIHNWKRRTK
jgi:hypothetical protein